jgi:Spy/CpxP family protein refolding chaperone
MKRPTFLLAALAVTGLALADQPQGPPPGGPGSGGAPIERLTQDLGLDAAQAAQVKQILDAQHAKMDAERAQFEASGTRPSREEMHAKHEQMDAELDQQLSAVLTPEQLAKFQELRKHRHMGPPPGTAPPGQGIGSQSQ